MTTEFPAVPANEFQAQVNRENIRKAKRFYDASGLEKLLDELRSKNKDSSLLITSTIHPVFVGKIIQDLEDNGSTYFDIYAWSIGKPKATEYADYEEIPCSLIIVQATPEGDIRFYGKHISTIPKQLWTTDRDSLKAALQIAYIKPIKFLQSRYSPSF